MRPARRRSGRLDTHRLPWLRHLVVVVVAASALAGSADEASDRQARALSTEGLTQFKRGHYAEAIAAFQASYALSPLPPLLFDAAQAYRLLGRCDDALTLYRRYLDDAPDAPNRAAAAARAVEMERCARAERSAASALAPSVAAAEPAAPLSIAPVVALTPPPTPIERRRRPAYRAWWLWTTVGGVVAAAVVAGAVVASERPTFHATLPGPTPTNAALRVRF